MDSYRLQTLLRRVQRPAQYLGNEVGAVRKDFARQRLRIALVFPDLYTIGMSHTGLKILYDILNGIEGVVAERCFAPAPDFEHALREGGELLYGLESRTPLREFDVIGVTLPYELTYTNLVNILDLAVLPVWQKDRRDNHPLVLAGGTGAYNPEPVADFLDAVAIGDGEELILDVVSCVLEWKKRNGLDRISENTRAGSRRELLDRLTEIEGIYVPSLFEPVYRDDGTIREVRRLKPGYTGVKKRVVTDLDAQPYPTGLVLPNIRLVHDRIGVEIQRGCTRMCRFCQAGYVDRPTRQRSPDRVLEIASLSHERTGISEISLLSLSAGDYATIVPTLKALNARFAGRNVAVSVPATRTETLTPELIAEVKKVRMSGFTIAPEAGSERMRRVINKGNRAEDLLRACRNAFAAGYRLIKFYYMCGLPFETDEDVAGIAREAASALATGLEYAKGIRLNVSVSPFVPKPFTPFQWVMQDTLEETRRKQDLIRRSLGDRRLCFKGHKPEVSYLEGLFARGDRRLSRVIYHAFENGCRLDEWEEYFDFGRWRKTFDDTGVNLGFYLHRERAKDEVFPWDHLFTQMRKDWLREEGERARREAFIADCSTAKCAGFCGICDFRTVKNRTYVVDERPLAAKKGHREAYGRFMTQGEPSACRPADGDVARGAPGPVPAREEKRFRLRACFSKTGSASLFGHLELMHHLKRAILRARIPVAYSGGFHPQIRISMGPALPWGMESECEYFDLLLKDRVDPVVVLPGLNAELPEGIKVMSLGDVDLRAEAIYARPARVTYRVRRPETVSIERWRTLREAPATGVSRNALSSVNIAPETVSDSAAVVEVAGLPGAMARPAEAVATLLGLEPGEAAFFGVRKTSHTTVTYE